MKPTCLSTHAQEYGVSCVEIVYYVSVSVGLCLPHFLVSLPSTHLLQESTRGVVALPQSVCALPCPQVLPPQAFDVAVAVRQLLWYAY